MAGEHTQHFGRRLKELREESGLSQSELAKQAEIPQQSIAAWESGQFDPGWSKVMKLCAALGVTCDAFAVPGGGAKRRVRRKG